MNRLYKNQSAFTIVELLVVIVVIGILAAITIVSYTGISSKATASALQSDLSNTSKQLKLFQITNSNYPDSISTSCSASTTTILCTKASSGTTYQYAVNNNTNPQSFYLTATKNSTTYKISSNTAPIVENSIVDGLVGRWSLDNNTGMTDLSFNGNNGTAVGGMTVGTAASHSGVANGATNFDGVDDYVDFGDKAVFDFTTAFTIALWLNIPSDTPDSYRGILAKYNASTGYDLGLANGLLNLSVRGSSQISTGNSGTTVRGRGYTHVVFTVTNSAIWRYIDGTADVAPNPATGTWTSVAASGYSLQIGHRNGGSTYLPAGISDVRIYNRALSQTEITSLYNSN